VVERRCRERDSLGSCSASCHIFLLGLTYCSIIQLRLIHLGIFPNVYKKYIQTITPRPRVSGLGLGLAYIPSIAAISFYFDEKINLASGIAVSGVGIGNFLYPPIIRFLVGAFDWKQSLLVLGAVSLHVCVFGGLMRPVKRPEVTEKQPILDISPFKKKGYIMLCVNILLFCCGISTVYVHLVAYAEKCGFGNDYSAMLISGLGVSNLVGRFLFGAIAHHTRSNPFAIYGIAFALSGVTICLIPAFSSYWLLMVDVCCFGLLSGCFGTLLVPILISLLGLRRFANGYGCLLLFMAAGQLIGAFASGWWNSSLFLNYNCTAM